MANILDLPRDQFLASLNELAAQGVNTDDLRRQYRRKNSIFAPIFDWASGSEQAIADQGRTTAGMGLLSKEAGTTGMDALRSLQLEPSNFVAGLLSGGAQAVDAPAAAAQGLIPAQDMPMEALGTAGTAQLGGAASMGRNILDYDPNTTRAFSDYLSKVNPSGTRIAASDRPNLMMGDMYGMLPRGARRLSQRDGVTFYRGPDGDYYATAFNPDVGEQDVVGYIMPRGDMTELAVVGEMQGQGIGSELQYLLRRENPDAQTGGLTEGGEAALRKTYDRLVDEGILSANRDATAGAIALPAARTEAEAMARQILEMRAAGRAGDVTDAMMAQADPQYMFNNTPLPMDEASRMARAGEMGFDVDNSLTHGSKRDIYGFSLDAPKSTDFGWYGQGVSLAPNNPSMSDAYAMVEKEGMGKWGGRTYPVMSRGRMYEWPEFNQPATSLEQSQELTQSLRGLGYEGANAYAPNDPDIWGEAAGSWREQTVYDPTNIRSRFARFDPAFSHLANLNAANASPLAGILAMPNEEERNRQLGLLFGGY